MGRIGLVGRIGRCRWYSLPDTAGLASSRVHMSRVLYLRSDIKDWMKMQAHMSDSSTKYTHSYIEHKLQILTM